MAALLVLFLLVFTFGVSVDQINIAAEPGENVILTCRADETRDVIVVEWSRPDLESDEHVLLYKDNQFDMDFQSLSFKNRVSLLDVKNGDVSLVLKNVTTDDTGTYECRVIQRGNNRRKRSQLDTYPISIIYLRVEPGNTEGPKKDGGKKNVGNWAGLIVGLSVGFFALFLLVGFLIYKYRRHLHQEQNPSAAAGVEHERMNPENHPPAGE